MNKSIFEKNLLELKRTNKELANRLKNLELNIVNTSEVFSVDGKAVLAVSHNGEYIQLDSLYDSHVQVEHLINSISEDMLLNAKLVMFGLGNGMYARYFINTTSQDHDIFVVEPSIDIFKTVMESFDLSDLFRDKRFHIEVLSEARETDYRSYFGNKFVMTDIYTLKHTVYTNYQILFPEELLIWKSQLEYTLSQMSSDSRLYQDHGERFVKNNYACFPYVLKSKSLRMLINNMPKDIPAILVSAGPSLNKNILELKNAKGKALIIAVDAAVNPLVKNGIIPDLMVCVDPTKGADYIKDEDAKNIPLVSGMNCGAELTKAHTGEKLYVSDLNPFLESFFIRTCGMLPRLSTGGSVANSAFHLAYLLGCKRIILVGQDLAYTDRKSHANGSIRGNETMEQVGKDIIESIDVNGKPVLTARMFLWFKNWFEDFIATHSDICVINATEGGMMIKGTKVMTLANAISSECKRTFDFREIVKNTDNLLDEVQGNDFVAYINNLPHELDKVILQIHEGIKCYSTIKQIAIKGNITSKALKDSSKKANEILDKIQKNPYLEYAKYLIQKYTNEMYKTINDVKDDVRKELMEISDIGTEYLKELEKEIFFLQELINNNAPDWNY